MTGLARRSWSLRWRAVGADDEHPGVEYIAATIVRFAGDRPVPVERLVGDLALDERDVEPPGLEHRDVLGAALGVPLLDASVGSGLVHRVGHRRAVHGKAAARCRRYPGRPTVVDMAGYPNYAPRYTRARGEDR